MKKNNKLMIALMSTTLISNVAVFNNHSVYADDSLKDYKDTVCKGTTIKEVKAEERMETKSVPEFNTIKDAALYLKEKMVNRESNITFVVNNQKYYQGIHEDIVDSAQEYSGNGGSSEGDYLKWHSSSYKVEMTPYSNTRTQFEYKFNYLSTKQQEQEVDKVVKSILEKLDIKNKDEYTKLKLIHDYIVGNVKYDYTLQKRSAYDALINKSSVCQGFATLTYKILKESGFEVRIISGVGNNQAHGWNIVKLGDKWYNIDNTWDANYSENGNPMSYTWFLKDKNNFPDHNRDAEFNTDEFNKKYPMATTPYQYTPGASTSVEFTDIKEHWAKNTIKEFASKKYINGYSDNTFKPNNNMTRAEFVKVVNKVFGYTEKGTESFTDVNTNDWFYNDICIAMKAGYIKGKSVDKFAPKEDITRQEVAVILTNIMGNKDTDYNKLITYTDGEETSDWAKSSVEGAIEAGYLSGNEKGELNPTSNITRAEAITMLSRVKK